MIMLDTNICIYILKEHPEQVLNKFLQNENLHISSVVYAELQYGIELSPNKVRQERFLQLVDFLSLLKIESWDQEAANHYAKIRATLKKQGNTIGNMDMLIAAHALSRGAILITNNTKEFSRILELKLENWSI